MAAPRTLDEALAFLSSLAPSGIRMGLERIHVALRALKNPERDFPALHVAGTNGKGSTCAFAAHCLATQGYRVGLYTSPHLVRVNERIRINGEEIRDEVLSLRIVEVLEMFPEAAREPFPLTYFEFGTLVALWHFSQENVDVAVLETGLGGRLDATNAARPAVTAVTPISYDHMNLLGHSLGAIAGEKAGIFKSGVPAVVAKQPAEAQRVIEETARAVGAPLRLEGRDFYIEPELGTKGTFAYRGMRTSLTNLSVALKGEHQRQNATMALACLELLSERGLRMSPESARAGLVGTQWPGRLEEISTAPLTVIDGAHNPGGVEVLNAAVKQLYPGRKIHLVFGVLADKDHRPMVKALFPRCASVHLTPLPGPRGLDPSEYLTEGKGLCANATVYTSVLEALAGARQAAGANDLVLCTGSLMLVGAIKAQGAAPPPPGV